MRIPETEIRSERHMCSIWVLLEMGNSTESLLPQLACQRITDSIRYIIYKKGFQIFNYFDDFIGCEPPTSARDSFQ